MPDPPGPQTLEEAIQDIIAGRGYTSRKPDTAPTDAPIPPTEEVAEPEGVSPRISAGQPTRPLSRGEVRNAARREQERLASLPPPEGFIAKIADTVFNPLAPLAVPVLAAEAISPGNPFSGFVRNIGSGIRESLGNILANVTPLEQPPRFLSPDLPTTTPETIGRAIGTGLANIPFAGSAVPESEFLANRARRPGLSALDTALINLEVGTLPVAGGVSPQQIGVGVRGLRAALGARRAPQVVQQTPSQVARDISTVAQQAQVAGDIGDVARRAGNIAPEAPAVPPIRRAQQTAVDVELGTPLIEETTAFDPSIRIQQRAPQQISPEFNIPRPIRELQATEGTSRFIAPDSPDFASVKQFVERHVEPGFNEVRVTSAGNTEVTIGSFIDPISGKRNFLVIDPRTRPGRSALVNRGRIGIRTEEALGRKAPLGTIKPQEADAVARTTDDLFRDTLGGVQRGETTISPAGIVSRVEKPSTLTEGGSQATLRGLTAQRNALTRRARDIRRRNPTQNISQLESNIEDLTSQINVLERSRRASVREVTPGLSASARAADSGRVPPPPSEPIRQASSSGRRPSSEFVDELLNAHIDRPEAQDILRQISEKLEGIPGVGSLIRAINPSAVARNNPALREAVGYRLLEQTQDANNSLRVARFAKSNPFDIDDEGRLLVGAKRIAFGDVAENPSQFPLLTPEQRQWIEDGWQYIDELADDFERVSGRSIRSEIAREHYWPRFVRNEGGGVSVRARVGARQSSARERIFEALEDGLERGVPYVNDPAQQIQLYGQALSKMTRDAILEKRLVSSGLARRLASGRPLRNEIMLTEAFANKRFGTLVFEKKTADILRGPLTGGENRFLRAADMLAAVPRQLVTGLLDSGQFMIQGLTLLANSPTQWARAVGVGLRTMVQPRFYARWLNNSAAARRAVEFGVDPGMPSEFFQATSLLGRIPGVGKLARAAQRTFNSFLGAGRINMFDGFADAAKLAGEPDAELFRLARAVDSMLGVTSTKGLGVGATQRQVESAFGFFSPRYTRSILGTVSYMFGKGFTPKVVRKVMAKMLFGGAATYAGIVTAKGVAEGRSQAQIEQDIITGLNPASGKKFLSIRIGDQWYGLGGAYRSHLAFLGSLADKDNWDFDSWDEAALNNPITRFMRSRTSPVTSTLVDFISGEDFLGRPVGIGAFAEDPKRFLDYVGQKLGPFPVQAALETFGSVESQVAGGVAEAGGLRVSPASFTDIADEIAKELNLKGPYRNLEPYEKDDVEKDPRLQAADERGFSPRVFRELDAVDREKDAELQALADNANKRVRDPQTGASVRVDRNYMRRQFSFIESARFNEKKGIRRGAGQKFEDDPKAATNQKALDGWYDLGEKATINGIFIFDALERLRERYLKALQPVQREYVLRNTNLREPPEAIFRVLGRSARERHQASQDARDRHRKTRIVPQKETPLLNFDFLR